MGGAERLINDLQNKYVMGLVYLPGGKQLVERFENLKGHLMCMSSVAGWENEPWFVKQGNVLLKQLRMQHMFSVSGTRQSELEEQLRIECDDPLEKANAIIVDARQSLNAVKQQSLVLKPKDKLLIIETRRRLNKLILRRNSTSSEPQENMDTRTKLSPEAQGIRQELDNSGAKFKGIQRMPSSFKYSTKNLFNALQNNKKYRSHNRQNANGRLTRKYCWKYPAEHDGRTQRGRVEFPGEIWTVSFWLRPSLKSKNKKTTHT